MKAKHEGWIKTLGLLHKGFDDRSIEDDFVDAPPLLQHPVQALQSLPTQLPQLHLHLFDRSPSLNEIKNHYSESCAHDSIFQGLIFKLPSRSLTECSSFRD